MSNRRKFIKILLIELALIAVIIVISALCFITFIPKGFGLIPPQDCLSVRRSFQGQVTNSTRNPIVNATITFTSVGGLSSKSGNDLDTIFLKTDKNGHFEQEDLYAYSCYTLNVDISADNYETRHLTYLGYDVYIEEPTTIEIAVTLRTQRYPK